MDPGRMGRPRPGNPAGPHRMPLDRWNQMSPEERQRELKKLPPERQKQIQERVDEFNHLPQEEQQRLRERYARFSQLSPERQDIVRRQIRRFNELDAERRRIVGQELTHLRGVPEADRRARINSEDFRTRFSLSEQQLIEDLSQILPTPK